MIRAAYNIYCQFNNLSLTKFILFYNSYAFGQLLVQIRAENSTALGAATNCLYHVQYYMIHLVVRKCMKLKHVQLAQKKIVPMTKSMIRSGIFIRTLFEGRRPLQAKQSKSHSRNTCSYFNSSAQRRYTAPHSFEWRKQISERGD